MFAFLDSRVFWLLSFQQLEGVLSQTGRENGVLCCLLAFTEVRRPSFLTRNVFLVLGCLSSCHEGGWKHETRFTKCVFQALSSLGLERLRARQVGESPQNFAVRAP